MACLCLLFSGCHFVSEGCRCLSECVYCIMFYLKYVITLSLKRRYNTELMGKECLEVAWCSHSVFQLARHLSPTRQRPQNQASFPRDDRTPVGCGEKGWCKYKVNSPLLTTDPSLRSPLLTTDPSEVTLNDYRPIPELTLTEYRPIPEVNHCYTPIGVITALSLSYTHWLNLMTESREIHYSLVLYLSYLWIYFNFCLSVFLKMIISDRCVCLHAGGSFMHVL